TRCSAREPRQSSSTSTATSSSPADMHPVLGLLAARARAGGARGDGAALALVIEGGGMRGVVSSAMAAAIEARGLTRCLDLVVGTSAGALNGAALLAG